MGFAQASSTSRKRKRGLHQDLQDFLLIDAEEDNADMDDEYVTDSKDSSGSSTPSESESESEESEADDIEDIVKEASKSLESTASNERLKKRLRKKKKVAYNIEPLDSNEFLEELEEEIPGEEQPGNNTSAKHGPPKNHKPCSAKAPSNPRIIRSSRRPVIEEYNEEEEVKIDRPTTPTKEHGDTAASIPTGPPPAPKKRASSRLLTPPFSLSDYDTLRKLCQEPCPSGLVELFSRLNKTHNLVAKMFKQKKGGTNLATKTMQLQKASVEVMTEIKNRIRVGSTGKEGNPAILELCLRVQSSAANEVLLKKLFQMKAVERFKLLKIRGEKLEDV